MHNNDFWLLQEQWGPLIGYFWLALLCKGRTCYLAPQSLPEPVCCGCEGLLLCCRAELLGSGTLWLPASASAPYLPNLPAALFQQRLCCRCLVPLDSPMGLSSSPSLCSIYLARIVLTLHREQSVSLQALDSGG